MRQTNNALRQSCVMSAVRGQPKGADIRLSGGFEDLRTTQTRERIDRARAGGQ
jgi:hypothetical protein